MFTELNNISKYRRSEAISAFMVFGQNKCIFLLCVNENPKNQLLFDTFVLYAGELEGDG